MQLPACHVFILKGVLSYLNNTAYIYAVHLTMLIEDFDTTIDMFVP
jgi:hypothetical protein